MKLRGVSPGRVLCPANLLGNSRIAEDVGDSRCECIVTIDAMGCQKSITQSIIDTKADYVLALKGNQGSLYGAVRKWFEQAQAQGFSGIEYSYYETKEGNHDRIEIRKYWTVPVSVLGGKYQKQWPGLCSIGMVISERRL